MHLLTTTIVLFWWGNSNLLNMSGL